MIESSPVDTGAKWLVLFGLAIKHIASKNFDMYALPFSRMSDPGWAFKNAWIECFPGAPENSWSSFSLGGSSSVAFGTSWVEGIVVVYDGGGRASFGRQGRHQRYQSSLTFPANLNKLCIL